MTRPSGSGEGGDIDVLAAPYTGIGASPATTLEEQLDWQTLNLGGYAVIASEADLEIAFPNVAGVYTVNRGAVITKSFTLTTGRWVDQVSPGMISTLGAINIMVDGDAAGRLFRCESAISGLAIKNNGAGYDLEIDSPLGAGFRITNIMLLGLKPLLLTSAAGGELSGLITPPGPGATGIDVVGAVANILFTDILFTAPGTTDYTAINVAATAVVSSQLVFTTCSLVGVRDGDVMIDIDAAASIPGGTLPTDTVGVRSLACFQSGPGRMFAPGSVDPDDIRHSGSGNQNGINSRIVGEAVGTIGAGSPDFNIDFTLVTIGDKVPVPVDNSSNGGAGPTLETVQLLAESSRMTLLGDGSLRYDGPDSGKSTTVIWSLDIKKDGAANTITGWMQRETLLGGVWETLDSTISTPRLAPTVTNTIVGRGQLVMASGDKFRVVVSSDGNSAINIPRQVKDVTAQ